MPTLRDYDQALTPDDRRVIYERDNYTCQDCGHKGVPNDGSLHVHHIKQYRMGGEHVDSNLITLCSPCHQERDRDYRSQLGRERMAKKKIVRGPHGWRWVNRDDS